MVVAAAPDTPCLEPLQLPLRLAQELRLSPEQFELVCQANPDAVLELSADGRLIAMTPTGSETSARNGTLVVLLGLALRASGLPFKLFESSCGFRLPDGSVLSPDLVVELASPSDEAGLIQSVSSVSPAAASSPSPGAP